MLLRVTPKSDGVVFLDTMSVSLT